MGSESNDSIGRKDFFQQFPISNYREGRTYSLLAKIIGKNGHSRSRHLRHRNGFLKQHDLQLRIGNMSRIEQGIMFQRTGRRDQIEHLHDLEHQDPVRSTHSLPNLTRRHFEDSEAVFQLELTTGSGRHEEFSLELF